jgi:hypothetical protein
VSDRAVKSNEAELAPNGSRHHGPPDGLRLADHSRLMAMCFTLDCACGVFGIVTVSTPFLNAADTLSSSSRIASVDGCPQSACPTDLNQQFTSMIVT